VAPPSPPAAAAAPPQPSDPLIALPPAANPTPSLGRYRAALLAPGGIRGSGSVQSARLGRYRAALLGDAGRASDVLATGPSGAFRPAPAGCAPVADAPPASADTPVRGLPAKIVPGLIVPAGVSQVREELRRARTAAATNLLDERRAVLPCVVPVAASGPLRLAAPAARASGDDGTPLRPVRRREELVLPPFTARTTVRGSNPLDASRSRAAGAVVLDGSRSRVVGAVVLDGSRERAGAGAVVLDGSRSRALDGSRAAGAVVLDGSRERANASEPAGTGPAAPNPIDARRAEATGKDDDGTD
jgi:hypothetical protein